MEETRAELEIAENEVAEFEELNDHLNESVAGQSWALGKLYREKEEAEQALIQNSVLLLMAMGGKITLSPDIILAVAEAEGKYFVATEEDEDGNLAVWIEEAEVDEDE